MMINTVRNFDILAINLEVL